MEIVFFPEGKTKVAWGSSMSAQESLPNNHPLMALKPAALRAAEKILAEKFASKYEELVLLGAVIQAAYDIRDTERLVDLLQENRLFHAFANVSGNIDRERYLQVLERAKRSGNFAKFIAAILQNFAESSPAAGKLEQNLLKWLHNQHPLENLQDTPRFELLRSCELVIRFKGENPADTRAYRRRIEEVFSEGLVPAQKGTMRLVHNENAKSFFDCLIPVDYEPGFTSKQSANYLEVDKQYLSLSWKGQGQFSWSTFSKEFAYAVSACGSPKQKVGHVLLQYNYRFDLGANAQIRDYFRFLPSIPPPLRLPRFLGNEQSVFPDVIHSGHFASNCFYGDLPIKFRINLAIRDEYLFGLATELAEEKIPESEKIEKNIPSKKLECPVDLTMTITWDSPGYLAGVPRNADILKDRLEDAFKNISTEKLLNLGVDRK